ncbi:MAG: DNA internalization-related competence protein ComEC/Rec2 [Bacillota bacterium]|nr:DNA internalization-related competence protein ComEC/Rec2 [Bacillota bacterium]MDW7683439.1 DNA internalization-related competence protein ComEC/Rec2 [Bacillota bacterium]
MPATLPWVCAAFMAGIVFAAYLPIPAIALALAALAAAACTLCLIAKKKRAAVPLLFLFCLLGMLSLTVAEREIHGPLQPVLDSEVTLTGYVREVDFYDESVVFILQTEEATVSDTERVPLHARVRVRVYTPPDTFAPEYGTRLQVKGRLQRPSGQRNPGGFNYAGYLESVGVGALMSTRSAHVETLEGKGGSAPAGLIHRARTKAATAIRDALPSAEAGLAQGILLGDRRGMEDETIDAYQVLGIAHLLAVSGLHVGFVAAFALFLSARVSRLRGRFVSYLPALLLILGYVLLSGGRPPVWRAALMFFLALTARQAGRENDGLLALCTAAMVLLFFQPYWLFGLSFQFSFLATAGILVLAPRLQPYLIKLPAVLSAPLAVTLAAQLTVLPLQAYHFGAMSLFAVPVNLLCVPLVGIAMILGLAGVLAGLVFLPLAIPLYWSALPILSVLARLPRVIAGLPFASFRVHTVHPVIWALYLTGLLLFVLRVRLFPLTGKKVIIGLVVLHLVAWTTLPVTGRSFLDVTFLDVGQGMSIHIRTPAGKHLLIDAGSGAGFDAGENIVLPYLRRRRVGMLDLIILTHPHEDHYGGMQAVVCRLPVKGFLSNGDSDDTAAFKKLTDALLANDVPRQCIGAGSRVVLEQDVFLEVLSPPKKRLRHTGDDVNNNSLVMRLTYHEFSLLITGDAEHDAVSRLTVGQGDHVQSNILQVPHHGSGGALSPTFLDFLGAQAAVIPVGKNSFGHPHPATLELLRAYGMTVWRTDLHGAVTVQSDGKSWHICPHISHPAPDMEYAGQTFIDSPGLVIIR